MNRAVRSKKKVVFKYRDNQKKTQVETDHAHHLGGAWLRNLAELKVECTSVSSMHAFFFRSSCCRIHERCDGSCGNDVGYQENPMIDPEDLVMSVLFGMAGGGLTKATIRDLPHDAQWLEQQRSSELVYLPINGLKGEIRLLRVKEALFRVDIVECELITTSLDQCEGFIALPYCWGSDKQSEVMLCNGERHRISTSLNTALKASRESIQTRGRLLWCDAVSIDQRNESGKSEQIPLMRRIYSEADACLVYLGEGGHLVTQGLSIMLRLGLLQRHLKSPEKRGSIPANGLLTLLPSHRHSCWTEYLRIFTSPWFGRTWTLQEIALSKKALLGIGSYVVPWHGLEDSFDFLKKHNLLFKIGPYPEGAMEHELTFMRIQEVRKISQSPDSSSALIAVLRATRHFKVTDPRDKIFAILGMIGDLPDGLKSIVDYKLSAGEVFHRAALYMCKHPDPVNLLAHAGLQRQSGQWDMPSWVPDWYSDDRARNERPLKLFRPEQFIAGGEQWLSWTQAGSAASPPRELFTLGLCHHRISQASDPYTNTKPTLALEACNAWLDSTRRCIESSRYLVYDDVEEAVARTLLVDDLYTGGNVTMSTTAISNPKMTFRAAIAEMDRAKRSKDAQEALNGLAATAKNDAVKTFILQMTSAMRGRRFAITDTGYTCLVPACAEIGDAVAVFFGHPTPFTIRLEPGSEMSESGLERVHARLVGDTYMHGVMYGEMFVEAVETGRTPCEIGLI